MKSTRLLIIAWLLLLVPTLLLGAAALHLLQGEEQRLQGQVREAAQNRARSVAESIDLAVSEVQDGLLQTLRQLPRDGLQQRLDAWQQGNPLVRNVFIWQAERGLLFPPPEQPGNAEEAAFVLRYQPLFSGEEPWQQPSPDVAPIAPSPSQSSYTEARKELRSLAQQAPTVVAEADVAAKLSEPAGTGGWRSWFADNRLHLLGWYAPDGEERRYGVEVELMALLARIGGTLPHETDGDAFLLLDGEGRVMQRSGPERENGMSDAVVEIALQSLPHWRLVVHPRTGSAGESSGFLLVSSLLLGAVVLTVLLGGTTLLWQATRHQREARSKTTFVSSVSHELKTPLTTIRMYAELLGEGTVTDEQKRSGYLDVIIRESQRLTRLVNNVLSFSRLEQGKKLFARERLDLVELLHDLLDSQVKRIDDSGMGLDRRLPQGPLSIDSDRDAIEQIVLNLLDNALKYAVEGEELLIEVVSSSADVTVRVCDRGPGIPADQREAVFSKFHRIDTSLTSRQQGTGLGLSIARQLALGLGGDLVCTGRDGGGACFELSLPRSRHEER